MYWNTTMQQYNIWSIAFEECTKVIMQAVSWINGPSSILHTQTDTRFEPMSIRLYVILFIEQGTLLQSFKISTMLNPPQSFWSSLIPFWQTMSIFFLWPSVWKVVYVVQMQCRESRKLLTNGWLPLYLLIEVIRWFGYIKVYHRVNYRGKYAAGFY